MAFCSGGNNEINGIANIMDEDNLSSYIQWVVSNTYLYNSNNLMKKTFIGIPMGTDCAPELANLTLYVDESKFIDNVMITDMAEAKRHA